MKTINLPHGLVIQIGDSPADKGRILQRFKRPEASDLDSIMRSGDDVRLEIHIALSALESIILAHARMGVDVTSPAYVKGIEIAHKETNELQ
jgi:hypothetical protein